MYFAMNWSPEASNLLVDNRIQVDFWKCPDWDDLVEEAKMTAPAYIHFPLAVGRGQSLKWDLEKIEAWLGKTDTRYINCHITPTSDHFPDDINIAGLVDSLTKELQPLVTNFGQDRIIIENCPYYSGNIERNFLSQGMTPQLFTGIVEQIGCGFLFDIAHAVLTCETLNTDIYDYINQLPTSHIEELHITGIGLWKDGRVADHKPLRDEDWDLFKRVLQNIDEGNWKQPEVIAFEYGGIGPLKEQCGSSIEAMAEQVPRLYELVKKTGIIS